MTDSGSQLGDRGGSMPPEARERLERQFVAGRPAVLLKLQDEVRVSYQDGVELELEARGIVPWTQLRQQFAGIRFRRLFVSLPSGDIEQLVGLASTRDASYRPPNFLTYFVIECPDTVDAAAVASALRGLPGVEYAHPAPRAHVPAGGLPRPKFRQQYTESAPDGIDAEYAWTIPGGHGGGQTIVDLEAGWLLDHDDLQLTGKAGVVTASKSSALYEDHGTAVLGVLRAIDDGVGCIGIAHQADVQLASIASATAPHVMDSTLVPDAIFAALKQLGFGNVLLLEVEIAKIDQGVERYLPCEAEPAFFEPIRLATALGIVVVEAAGSNDVDLDTFQPVDALALNTSSPAYRDSGAIVVGGATSATPHAQLNALSARGSLIDSYAWGESVTTCWADSTPSTSVYTTGFNGTSAAAAIVAAAALSVQGMAEATLLRRYGPGELRDILRDPANGTPVTGSNRVIPNLRWIADTVIGATPDVYVRDYVGDAGDPDGISHAMSPDIIVRAAQEADPTAAFGEGSGNEDHPWLSDLVQSGQDNYVYVRIRNRGGSDATQVVVTVYWSEPATLITPAAWRLIGTVTVAAVPADDRLIVSAPITWAEAALPPPGHHCLVAIVGTAADPAPQPAYFAARPAQAWDHFVAFISVNNNVAWRNVDVVSPDVDASGLVRLDFLMRGAFDRARPMQLEIVTHLPPAAEVALEAPEELAELWRAYWGSVERRNARARIRVPSRGRWPLPPIDLPVEAAAPLTILVRLPAGTCDDGRTYSLYARQLWEGVEVGRVSWTLARQNEPERPDRRSRAPGPARRAV